MILLYTTEDASFALLALEALREAGIAALTNPVLGAERQLIKLPDTEYERPAPDPWLSRRSDSEIAVAYRAEYKASIEQSGGFPSRYFSEIGIFALNEKDFERASALLLMLGAVPANNISARTASRLNRLVTTLAMLALILIAWFILDNRHR